MSGIVESVNICPEKGQGKEPKPSIDLIAGVGVEGDAHAGGDRQLSLLAQESIDKGVASGVDLNPGDFGENITTRGFDLGLLKVGDRLQIGPEAVVQISELGKVCHEPCSIGRRLGDCIMPRDGVFAKVMRAGSVTPGDTVELTSIKVGAVLTSSDRCAAGEREDESGPLLVRFLEELDIALADYSILPDEETQLAEKLRFLADRRAVDLILTTGGTGFSPRDHTPEATLAILDAQAPGISEALRAEGLRHTPNACLSRGVSGIRGRTLIINLPGSKKAVAEGIEFLRKVIPHTLETMRGEVTDCGPSSHPGGH